MTTHHVPQTFATIELFGDFACAFRDPETNLLPTQSLGELARHKGQRISRVLAGLAKSVQRLVQDSSWQCHWDCHMFHFESQLPQPQAAAELVAAAEVAAEWFQIGEYNGQGESFDFPKPCRWGPPMSLVRANRFALLAPTHEIRSIVELDVLADFEVEMLLSGVGQQHMDWNAVNRPALVWPVKDFDLPSHLCSLGLAIEQRLSSMSAFFGAISREVPAWVLEPKAQLAVCGSPLTPADTEGFVQRLNVPMDRVRIATPEEHLCNSHLPVD